jgi:hypothetical protein
MEIALGATDQRLVPVLRVKRFLDLAGDDSEAGPSRRIPPTKPPDLAAGMLSRLIHGNGLYLVVDPSGARRWLLRLDFMGSLSRGDVVTMVMPGNYSNVVWPIGDIMPTLTTLGECVGAYTDNRGIPNLNIKP